MTLQPAGLIAPDVELLTTGYLRLSLSARTEPFASSVRVDNKRTESAAPRQVAVRRDGGAMRGVFDNPRLGVRVWADVEQDASDLSRLVLALLLDMPGYGPVVRVTHLSGPSGVPDESPQFQKYLTLEMRVRCTPL